MRQIGAFIIALLLVGCELRDKHYFQVHPEALKQAMERCPEISPSRISCEALGKIAEEINKLAYALQKNPPEFGQSIMALQNELAALTEKDDPLKIASLKEQLSMRLALVAWLESPES